MLMNSWYDETCIKAGLNRTDMEKCLIKSGEVLLGSCLYKLSWTWLSLLPHIFPREQHLLWGHNELKSTFLKKLLKYDEIHVSQICWIVINLSDTLWPREDEFSPLLQHAMKVMTTAVMTTRHAPVVLMTTTIELSFLDSMPWTRSVLAAAPENIFCLFYVSTT